MESDLPLKMAILLIYALSVQSIAVAVARKWRRFSLRSLLIALSMVGPYLFSMTLMDRDLGLPLIAATLAAVVVGVLQLVSN